MPRNYADETILSERKHERQRTEEEALATKARPKKRIVSEKGSRKKRKTAADITPEPETFHDPMDIE